MSRAIKNPRKKESRLGPGPAHIHFIGIGGIGMSGIAAIFIRSGWKVSGSDEKDGPLIKRLKAQGVKISIGHAGANIDGADVVVYSSAIDRFNPELALARGKGIKVIHRSCALAELIGDKRCVAVSGSHGKTTTSALAAHLLAECEKLSAAVLGGISLNLDDSVYLGGGDIFVVEADESDGSFLRYNPSYPIITNIDREHLDFYAGWDEILRAYKNFLLKASDQGCIFSNGDDPAVRAVTKGLKKRIVYFGMSSENDFYPKDIKLNEFSSSFDYYRRGKRITGIKLPLAGAHNISNCLAIAALADELGIPPEESARKIASFKGTQRRFQLKFNTARIKLIDDYGHHPAELKAVLAAAKNIAHKRLVAVFQPHRYSRTKLLMEEFVQSFSLADMIVLMDIYPASEPPMEGINSGLLCQKIRSEFPAKEVILLEKENAAQRIMETLQDGDLIITIGAGDIGKVSDELAQRLECRYNSKRAPG